MRLNLSDSHCILYHTISADILNHHQGRNNYTNPLINQNPEGENYSINSGRNHGQSRIFNYNTETLCTLILNTNHKDKNWKLERQILQEKFL
ncbi:hypothetical protein H8356DRAFT_1325424 [Neocallimastix lanati (nom. inval.)]|nr:hypothetical protein H8356DRAFT_1325424 [Neocallimastix sp. JGI-2020a]